MQMYSSHKTKFQFKMASQEQQEMEEMAAPIKQKLKDNKIFKHNDEDKKEKKKV